MERGKIESRKTVKGQASRQEDDVRNRVRKSRLVLYLDTSAIVKKYVREKGSEEVIQAIAWAETTGTARIAKVEMAAAFGKAVRVGILSSQEAEKCLKVFRANWPHYYVAEISDALIDRAESYAWSYRLRGYDAVHLAAAATWQEELGDAVTVATFDIQLWDAVGPAGLHVYPANLHQLIEEWR